MEKSAKKFIRLFVSVLRNVQIWEKSSQVPFFRHFVSGIAVADVNKIQHLASMHYDITHVSSVQKKHVESLLLFGKAIR